MSKPGAAAAAESEIFRYPSIGIGQLMPSPLNPRKHFERAALEDLAASMGNGTGVLEPLLIRPTAGAKAPAPFEIVAGERRWRAAQIAGLDEVPIIVRALTDAQVLELMMVENTQRKDMRPLEEAHGFKQLLSTFGFARAVLAKRLGHTEQFIRDRVRLLELVPTAKKLLEQGRLPIKHAELLATLTKEQQAEALEVDGGHGAGWASGPLFESDDRSLLTAAEDEALDKAETKDPYASMRVKSLAQFRSWIATHVRFDTSAKDLQDYLPDTATTLEQAERVIHITYNHHVHPDAKEDGQRTYGPQSWKRADGREKSKTCDFSVTGVVVVGPGRGQAFPVCANKDTCNTHWGAEQRAKQRRAKASASGASGVETQRREEEARKKRQAEEQATEQQWKAARGALLTAAAEKVNALPLTKIIGELLSSEDKGRLKEASQLLGVTGAPSADQALRLLLAIQAIAEFGTWEWRRRRDFTTWLKKVLGLDAAAIVKASAKAAAPTPAKKAKAR